MKYYTQEEIKSLIKIAISLDITLYQEMTFADIESVIKYFALKEQWKEIPKN